jgi:hypothetical protein
MASTSPPQHFGDLQAAWKERAQELAAATRIYREMCEGRVGELRAQATTKAAATRIQASHGRPGHLYTPCYVSFVRLHTKQPGALENDFGVHDCLPGIGAR